MKHHPAPAVWSAEAAIRALRGIDKIGSLRRSAGSGVRTGAGPPLTRALGPESTFTPAAAYDRRQPKLDVPYALPRTVKRTFIPRLLDEREAEIFIRSVGQ